MNDNEIMEYVWTHKEPKTVLHDIITQIMETKPAAPIGHIRDFVPRDEARNV